MTMYRHSRLQSPDGFTLIELMIVVAILGILVSVATVSYNYFVTKAKTVEERSWFMRWSAWSISIMHLTRCTRTSFADLGFP